MHGRLFRHLLIVLLVVASVLPAPAQEPGSQDTLLTAQLRKAFRQVDGLEQVTLEVRGGVVVLRGAVPSLEASRTAEDLASKLDGVLTVDNGLRVEHKLSARLTPTFGELELKTRRLLSYLPLLAVALALFLGSLLLARWVRSWDWIYPRLSNNVFIQDLLRQGLSSFLILAGAFLALEILDATALVGALLGTAGVVGVALGFAFQDLAENSLASILLSLRQPFAPNDHVVIDGQEGKVVRLTSRATVLMTLDGNHLRLPNAAVFKATILNFSKNPERRFRFSVGIDTGLDLGHAQSVALETLSGCPGVLKRPAPQCLVEELGDSTVNLVLYAWVDQRNSEYVKVRSEAIRRLKEAFDEADIEMPEPIYKVRLEKSGRALPKDKPRVESSLEVDVQPETHLEERIHEERQGDEADLLSASAKME